MILKPFWVIAAIAAIAQVSGCKPAEDEYAPAFVPKFYSFQGKADPQYVGSWKTADGSSLIDLGKDGDLKIDTTTRSIAGKNVAHVTGKWLADNGDLLFQYVVGSQPPTTIKYKASLSGNSLLLVSDSGRQKTSYRRQ